MTTYVVDASVVAQWFFPERYSEKCRELLSNLHQLLAPDLIWPEVGNIVWKRFARGEINGDEALECIADIVRMPVIDISSQGLLPSAVGIAAAVGITVYDALYVALALSRNSLLVTADEKLIAKVERTCFASAVGHVSQFKPSS